MTKTKILLTFAVVFAGLCVIHALLGSTPTAKAKKLVSEQFESRETVVFVQFEMGRSTETDEYVVGGEVRTKNGQPTIFACDYIDNKIENFVSCEPDSKKSGANDEMRFLINSIKIDEKMREADLLLYHMKQAAEISN